MKSFFGSLEAWKLGSFLLCACGSSSTTMMTTPDAGTDTSTPMTICDIASAIDPSRTPPPAASTKATLETTNMRSDFTVAWSVTLGSVNPMDGNTVDWSFDANAGANSADMGTITVTVSADGCDDKDFTKDVTIDFPDAERTIVLYN